MGVEIGMSDGGAGGASSTSETASRSGGERRSERASKDKDGPESEEENYGEQQTRGARAPYQPSAQEIETHNMTHCPPRAWCDHCVKGQFKDQPHKTARGTDAESNVPRINIDYFFLKDDVTVTDTDHEQASIARTSMTCMCMQETMCHSVWDTRSSRRAPVRSGLLTKWLMTSLSLDWRMNESSSNPTKNRPSRTSRERW